MAIPRVKVLRTPTPVVPVPADSQAIVSSQGRIIGVSDFSGK
jgi:hypothetical protein